MLHAFNRLKQYLLLTFHAVKSDVREDVFGVSLEVLARLREFVLSLDTMDAGGMVPSEDAPSR